MTEVKFVNESVETNKCDVEGWECDLTRSRNYSGIDTANDYCTHSRRNDATFT